MFIFLLHKHQRGLSLVLKAPTNLHTAQQCDSKNPENSSASVYRSGKLTSPQEKERFLNLSIHIYINEHN
jgi:hypothetical protein